MYRISCLAYPVSHILYASPSESTGHQTPREAMGGHGGQRGATGGNGGPTGGQRGAMGGNGGQRGTTAGRKKVRAPQQPPFNILEDPYKLRQFGEILEVTRHYTVTEYSAFAE